MNSQQTPRPTMPEIGAWSLFAVGAVVYLIALIVLGNAEYDTDTDAALGWMTFAGGIAGIAFVPAIILTGLRYLVPAFRGVGTGESEPAHGEQRGGDVEHVGADIDGEDAEQHQ